MFPSRSLKGTEWFGIFKNCLMNSFLLFSITFTLLKNRWQLSLLNTVSFVVIYFPNFWSSRLVITHNQVPLLSPNSRVVPPSGWQYDHIHHALNQLLNTSGKMWKSFQSSTLLFEKKLIVEGKLTNELLCSIFKIFLGNKWFQLVQWILFELPKIQWNQLCSRQ